MWSACSVILTCCKADIMVPFALKAVRSMMAELATATAPFLMAAWPARTFSSAAECLAFSVKADLIFCYMAFTSVM